MELVLASLLTTMMLAPLFYLWRAPEKTTVVLESTWRDLAPLTDERLIYFSPPASSEMVDKAA